MLLPYMRSELDPRQERALELILGGSNLPAVAKSVGCTLPELYEWRYSLPWAEAMQRRLADLRAYTQARYVSHADEMLGIILDIARGKPEVDEEGNYRNTVKPADQLKAAQMVTEMAFTETSTYTTAAEWAAARESATKSVLGSLWTLSDREIVESVRGLKLLPRDTK